MAMPSAISACTVEFPPAWHRKLPGLERLGEETGDWLPLNPPWLGTPLPLPALSGTALVGHYHMGEGLGHGHSVLIFS